MTSKVSGGQWIAYVAPLLLLGAIVWSHSTTQQHIDQVRRERPTAPPPETDWVAPTAQAPLPASAGDHSDAGVPAASSPHTVYLPVYSHLPSGERGIAPLSVLVSVRNINPYQRLRLEAVEYYDTSGNRLRDYLKVQRELLPMQTLEYRVRTRDEAGGSGASFLVRWRGAQGAAPPLVEAVMQGSSGPHGISFVRQGINLQD